MGDGIQNTSQFCNSREGGKNGNRACMLVSLVSNIHYVLIFPSRIEDKFFAKWKMTDKTVGLRR